MNSNDTTEAQHAPEHPAWFRKVLGQYPTGVCIITATLADGVDVGMVVGSFTSVSLNPPLVAFLPDRSSSTWARLRHATHFCVNILGAEQAAVCSRFASKDATLAKFDGHARHRSPHGAPLIDAAVAWIDCERYRVYEAGDHDIVIGAVKHLDMSANGQPLLFCQGGYGQFVPFAKPQGTVPK